MGARASAAAMVAALAACGAPPLPPVARRPAAPPPHVPSDAAATPSAPAVPRARAELPRHEQRLPNGLDLIVVAAPAGADARLSFGVFVGAAAPPAVAELAAHALTAAGGEPGPSCHDAVVALGGTLALQAGTEACWLDLRVPAGRWSAAAAVLRAALDRVPSLADVDRLRGELVAARTTWLRRDPAALGRLLLLGQVGPAAHLDALLLPTAIEVLDARARWLRPAHAVLIAAVPGDPAAVAATLAGERGGFGDWSGPEGDPSAAPEPQAPPLPASTPSGLFWCPGAAGGPIAATIVLPLPDLGAGGATSRLLQLGCLVGDGNGGRFAQLQQERGLEPLRWRAELARAGDAAALLLSADVGPDGVPARWRALAAAHASLAELPPSPAELQLAHAAATATLSVLLDDAPGTERAAALARRRGRPEPAAALLAALEAAGPAAVRVTGAPPAMIVAGGAPPAGLAGVQYVDALPDAAGAATAPSPWLDLAVAAAGGEERLLRLVGWQATGTIGDDTRPQLEVFERWRDDGTLECRHTLGGATVATELRGDDVSQQLGELRQSLTADEAARLRAARQRHPLALLAAHARGELPWRHLAERIVGGRAVAVLVVEHPSCGRLRLHVDRRSHLLRGVVAWTADADGAPVECYEAWSDWRDAGSLRAPHFVVATAAGREPVHTTWSQWTPELRAP